MAAMLGAVLVKGCHDDSLANPRAGHERLRTRSAIMLREVTAAGITEAASVATWEEVLAAMEGPCLQLEGDGGACGGGLGDAQESVCALNGILNAIQSPTAVRVAGKSLETSSFEMLPPSHPAVIALAEASIAESARVEIELWTHCSTGTPALDTVMTVGGEEVDRGDYLARLLGQLRELRLEFREHLVASSRAVGDSNFALATDRAQAALDSVGDIASPIHAAHVLVGGTEGLPFYFETPAGWIRATASWH